VIQADRVQQVDQVLGGEVAGAPGAYGQPPVPPVELSKQRIPTDSAAATLARAVPRVSWKWNAIRSSGMPASVARATIART
jgi:hypothetical protein